MSLQKRAWRVSVSLILTILFLFSSVSTVFAADAPNAEPVGEQITGELADEGSEDGGEPAGEQPGPKQQSEGSGEEQIILGTGGPGVLSEGPEEKGEAIGSVRVTVENTTKTGEDVPWTGLLFDDAAVPIYEGDTLKDAMETALTQHEIPFENSGEEPSAYLISVNGLGSTGGGGWMITLNDWFSNVGAGATAIEDKDEIRVMYTLNWGVDLGGDFNNTDTSLKALGVSAGVLSPAFDKDTLSYNLIVLDGAASVKVTPTASNKNYQVRTNVDGTVYKRTENIPIEDGTVIKVGCGDPAWPTMNTDTPPTLTEYTITVTTSAKKVTFAPKSGTAAVPLATIVLKNAAGEVQEPTDNPYVYELAPGDYSYKVSKTGYKDVTGGFLTIDTNDLQVPINMEIEVFLKELRIGNTAPYTHNNYRDYAHLTSLGETGEESQHEGQALDTNSGLTYAWAWLNEGAPSTYRVFLRYRNIKDATTWSTTSFIRNTTNGTDLGQQFIRWYGDDVEVQIEVRNGMTITSSLVETHHLTIKRDNVLTAMSVLDQNNTELEMTPAYNRDSFDYEVTVDNSHTYVWVDALVYEEVTSNGTRITTYLTRTVDGQTIGAYPAKVHLNGAETEIPVKLYKRGILQREYTITVKRPGLTEQDITFNCTSGGSPMEGVNLTVKNKAGEVVQPGEGGGYQLIPGVYTYIAQKSGYRPASGSFTVINGQPKTVNVSLRETTALHEVTLHVSKDDSEDISDVVLLLKDEDGMEQIPREGYIYDLDEGDYTYTATAEGYYDTNGAFTVGAAMTVPVVLRHHTGGYFYFAAEGAEKLEAQPAIVHYEYGDTLLDALLDAGYDFEYYFTTMMGGTDGFMLSSFNGDSSIRYFQTDTGYGDKLDTPAANYRYVRFNTSTHRTLTDGLKRLIREMAVYNASEDEIKNNPAAQAAYAAALSGYETVDTGSMGNKYLNIPESEAIRLAAELAAAVRAAGVTYAVTFDVTDGETAVQNAQIVVKDSNKNTIEQTAGAYDLSNGIYTYIINADGFKTAKGTFEVDGAVRTVEVVMEEGEPDPASGLKLTKPDGTNIPLEDILEQTTLPQPDGTSGSTQYIGAYKATIGSGSKAYLELFEHVLGGDVELQNHYYYSSTFVIPYVNGKYEADFYTQVHVREDTSDIRTFLEDTTGLTLNEENEYFAFRITVGGDHARTIMLLVELIGEISTFNTDFNITDSGTGEAVEDAVIKLVYQSQVYNMPSVQMTQKEDGTYDLHNGNYTYTISKKGYARQTGSFTVDDANRTINAALVEKEDTGQTANVTLTVTVDGKFAVSPDGTEVVKVPLEVPYFDLAEYGMEDLYRLPVVGTPPNRRVLWKPEYGNRDTEVFDLDAIFADVPEQPTGAHLWVAALEEYYLAEGDSLAYGSSDLAFDRYAGRTKYSLGEFMTGIWGVEDAGVKRTTVNYELGNDLTHWSLINDGDDIRIDIKSNSSYTYAYFWECEGIETEAGELVELTTRHSTRGQITSGYFLAKAEVQYRPVSGTADDWKTLLGSNVNKEGKAQFIFNEPGEYYVATGPKYKQAETGSRADENMIPDVVKVTVTGVAPTDTHDVTFNVTFNGEPAEDAVIKVESGITGVQAADEENTRQYTLARGMYAYSVTSEALEGAEEYFAQIEKPLLITKDSELQTIDVDLAFPPLLESIELYDALTGGNQAECSFDPAKVGEEAFNFSVKASDQINSLYTLVKVRDEYEADTTITAKYTRATTGAAYTRALTSGADYRTQLQYLMEYGPISRIFDIEVNYMNGEVVQIYHVNAERIPTARSISVIADNHTHPVLSPEFNSGTYAYEVTVPDTVESVNIAAVPGRPLEMYNMLIGGTSTNVHNLWSADVALTGDETVIPVQVALHESTDGSYDDTLNTIYTLTVKKEAVEPNTAPPLLADLRMTSSSSDQTAVHDWFTEFTPDTYGYEYLLSDAQGYNIYAWATLTSDAPEDTTITLRHRQQMETVNNGSLRVANITSGAASGSSLTRLGDKGFASVLVSVEVASESAGIKQTYALQLNRERTLSALSVTAGGSPYALSPAFAGTTYAYSVTVPLGTSSVVIKPTPSFTPIGVYTDGYMMKVDGESVARGGSAQVTIPPGTTPGEIEVEVSHTDGGTPTVYTLFVEKTPPARVTFDTTPEHANVRVTDSEGNRVLPEIGGVFVLVPGTEYSYEAAAKGYVGQTGTLSKASGTHTVALNLVAAEPNHAIDTTIEAEWGSFRGNENNNGVTEASVPTTAEDTMLYWATHSGSSGEVWTGGAPSSPILVGGHLYFYSQTYLYKVDKNTGVVLDSVQMVSESDFSITPPTYAEGLIFVMLKNGTIQAFNVATMESVWVYRDPLGGQGNSPITYRNGYIYTGFWKQEAAVANLVCLSITDEDPNNTHEEKLPIWRVPQTGGFYWAGSYACDTFVLVGTDDGSAEGQYTETANLLSIDPVTGAEIDSISGIKGDVRSTIAKGDDGKYYFTSKGGRLYEVSVNANGEFVSGSLRYIELDGMSTSTPVIYNGRAYVGVAGSGGQFTAYGGHKISVIDIGTWQVAYTANTRGYPQTSGLLTTAYASEEGYAYVYFIDNYTPGMVRVIKDKPGQEALLDGVTETYTPQMGSPTTKEDCAPVVFEPSGSHAQYAVSSPIVDEYGTMYFKNDSNYLFAVGSAITEIQVAQQPDKTEYLTGDAFDTTGMKVVAVLKNGMQRDITKDVTCSTAAFTGDEVEVLIKYEYVLYDGKKQQVTPFETTVDILVDERVPVAEITLPATTTVNAGSTVSLSLIVGPENATDKTVTWSSSDNEIATVTNTGVVKGVKAGTVTITAAANDDSGVYADCTVIVRPAAPKNAKAASAGYNSIKVSWGQVAGATGYEVWRSTDNKTFKNVKTITSGSTATYTDGALSTNAQYYYKIRAYATLSGVKQYSGYSAVMTATPKPLAPGSPKAASAGYSGIKVSWAKVAGASGYVVYQSTSSGGTYKNIKTITSGNTLSHNDTGLTSGKTYYYKVRAYRTVDGKKVYGAYSSIVSAKPVPVKVKSPKAVSTSYRSVKVSWAQVGGATGYEVYIATSSNGTYKNIKTITSGSTLSYAQTGLTSGKIYYYKIRAYRTVGGQKVYGVFSSVVSIKPIPVKVKSPKAVSAGYDRIKVSWAQVAGATGYEMYRATSSGGKYSRVSTITSGNTLSHTNTGLTSGKTYYYKVRAYRTVDGQKVYGVFSSVVSAKPIPVKVTSAKAASASYRSVKVSWAKVTGATGYEVYRATSSGGKYSRVSTITSGNTLSYTNTGLTSGRTYYYKVRAYRTVSGQKVYGVFSSVVSAKPRPVKVTGVKAASTSYRSIKVSWAKVTGATGYEVYRATSSGGKYSRVSTITSGNTLSYANTGLTSGRTYYYKVRAYRTVGGQKVYGVFSSVVSIKPIPVKVKSPKAASTSYRSIKVSWAKVTGATGYEVYRATSSGGKYSRVSTITSGKTVQHTNTGLTSGRTYYYKVRAYRTVGGQKVYGVFSNVSRATAR
ncbi:MAG: cadherin-like beta sandwich domain-containing protein [Christensenellales bacterium]|jgi:hypothetical protein